MSLQLTCEGTTRVEESTPGAVAFYRDGKVDHYQIDCQHPACVVILYRNEDNGWNDSLVGGSAYCADHAPEEVHEAKSSMSTDEFLLVTIPTEGGES